MNLETIIRCRQKDLMNLLRKNYKRKMSCFHGGSYLLIKGTAPIMLIAHLDTVHKDPVRDLCASSDGNVLMSPQGVGGDDRCGVYALTRLYDEARVKPWLLFTCGEEIGGLGAHDFAEDYRNGKLNKNLKSIRLLVELDRKGRNEAVYYDCDNPDLEAYITSKGYQTDFGTYSDISTIAPVMGVAAVNLSAGYYNAHTLHEYINRTHLDESIAKVSLIVADAAKKDFPKFEYIAAAYDPYRWGYPYEVKMEKYFDDVPDSVPAEYRDVYSLLLDFYSSKELEEMRKEYGDRVLDELYDIEYGTSWRDDYYMEDVAEAQ